MDQPIFILGALREEINLIRKLMIVKEQLKAGHADAWVGSWEGVSIVLVQTGMGKDCALSVLKEVLGRTVPAGDGVLVELEGDVTVDCLSNFVFSDPDGEPLTVELSIDIGIIFSEVEFLKHIGLEKQAEKIVNNHKNQRKEYDENYAKLEKEYRRKSDFAKETYVEKTTEFLGYFDAFITTKANQKPKVSKIMYLFSNIVL